MRLKRLMHGATNSPVIVPTFTGNSLPNSISRYSLQLCALRSEGVLLYNALGSWLLWPCHCSSGVLPQARAATAKVPSRRTTRISRPHDLAFLLGVALTTIVRCPLGLATKGVFGNKFPAAMAAARCTAVAYGLR